MFSKISKSCKFIILSKTIIAIAFICVNQFILWDTMTGNSAFNDKLEIGVLSVIATVLMVIIIGRDLNKLVKVIAFTEKGSGVIRNLDELNFITSISLMIKETDDGYMYSIIYMDIYFKALFEQTLERSCGVDELYTKEEISAVFDNADKRMMEFVLLL